MTETPTTQEEERLGELAQLLLIAADAAYGEASATTDLDVVYDLGDVGLGSYLAYNQVAALLPDGYEVQAPPPDERDPEQLLWRAEALLREFDPHSPAYGQLAGVVIAVGDLLREIRRVGRC